METEKNGVDVPVYDRNTEKHNISHVSIGHA